MTHPLNQTFFILTNPSRSIDMTHPEISSSKQQITKPTRFNFRKATQGNLRDLRCSLKLSYFETADGIANVYGEEYALSERTIRYAESGERNPKWETVVILIAYYQSIPPEKLHNFLFGMLKKQFPSLDSANNNVEQD
ncbi:MAG: hypothetical protein AAFQ83_22975 [Bacteroidota bacterium]